MSQIRGTHHVAIICSNIDRAREFYVGVLGFRIANETYRADRHSYKLDLTVGDGTLLELFSFPSSPPRPSYPEACGLRHLAFSVRDLDGTVRALRDRGVAVERIRVDESTGSRFTFFSDPDGLPLELYEVSETLDDRLTTLSPRLSDFIEGFGELDRLIDRG